MKFLKTASERAKKIGGIKSLIHREVGGYETARSKVEIHASDLTKDVEYCPREVRLMETLGKKQKDQWLPGVLRMTFDDGIAKQHIINNRYLATFMYGEWMCQKCFYSVGWSEGYPGHCNTPKCDSGRFEYIEPFFRDPVTKAQGSVDGLVKLPGETKLRMMESKIMATSMFRTLKAPLAEHKLRTQFYLALIARSEHPHENEIDTQKASVLYCLRGHGIKDENGEISPFKEFVVKRDDDAVEYLFDKAQALTTARAKGCLPVQICPHQMCPRAEHCPVSKECFSNVSSSPVKD